MQPLQILHQAYWQGPNLAGPVPAACLIIAAGEVDLFRDLPAETLTGLEALIDAALAPVAAVPRPVLERSPALLLAQLPIILQQATRHPVAAYGARKTDTGRAEIHFELLRPALLPSLLDCLQSFWLSGILRGETDLFPARFRAIRDGFTFTSQELYAWDSIRTAQRLGIEAIADGGNRVWLGRGHDRWLTAGGYTQDTPRLAQILAGRKSLSYRVLRSASLPLPEQRTAGSERAAIRAAGEIGYPVVVKPLRGHSGKGVGVKLANDREVAEAYAEASKYGPAVVVEQYVPGDDYRLLVVNGRFVAATKRIPAFVVGDGQHTVAELMAITNRRECRDRTILVPLQADQEVIRCLREQHLSLDSVPAPEQQVPLRYAANIALGGTTEDITDLVHPDTREAAVAAAAACLLDVAGIDLVSTDIARSWRKGYGKIIEINADPSIDMHLHPVVGLPRDVNYHIIRSHFPPSRRERLPTVVIAGRNSKIAVARSCARLWTRLGIAPGLLLDDKLIRHGRPLSLDKPFPERMAVLDRLAELDAVAVTRTPASLLQEGFCLERTTCAVLTDDLIDPELLAARDDAQLALRLYRSLADLCTHGVVIDGRSRILREAVAHLPPETIVAVWPQPCATLPPALQEHVARGGRALILTGAQEEIGHRLYWFDHNDRTPLLALPPAPELRYKSVMMAVAALLLSTAPLTQVLQVVRAEDFHARAPVHSLITDTFPEKGFQVACAIPQDAGARAAFCAQAKPGARVWLVASGRPGLAREWRAWPRALAGRQVHLMLEGEGDTAGEISPASYFHTMAAAWEMALDWAAEHDTVLLLATDSQQRLSLFHSRPRQSLSPQAHRGAPRWSAATLAELFQGTWINGPDSGWGVERIGWGADMTAPEMLTVLTGFPDQKDRHPAQVAELERTIAAGARAAVAPVVAIRLARWKPVLQSDNPLAGLLRLGRHARQRLEGLVIALCAPRPSRQCGGETLARALTGQAGQSVNVVAVAESNSLTPEITAALALANTRPGPAIHLIPWDAAEPIPLQILRPDLLVADLTGPPQDRTGDQFALLAGSADLIALIPPEAEKYCRELAQATPHSITLLPSTTGTDGNQGWAQVIAAVLEYLARKTAR